MGQEALRSSLKHANETVRELRASNGELRRQLDEANARVKELEVG
jgi:hypothetical protein